MYEAIPLTLTPEKATTILDNMIQFETMFSDYQPACEEVCGRCAKCMRRKATVARNLTRFDAAVWEVWSEEELVGILWLSDIVPGHDARGEFTFWDGELRGKRGIIESMIQHVFDDPLALHRITVEVPAHMKALARFVETKLDFQPEGRKREAVLRDGEWHDVLLFGRLSENGSG